MPEEKDQQTFAILGAAMEVHRTLGAGFLEAVYQAALAIELDERGIRYQREVEIPVSYKGQQLPCGFRADFVFSKLGRVRILERSNGVEHRARHFHCVRRATH